jgi:hypothetical protein
VNITDFLRATFTLDPAKPSSTTTVENETEELSPTLRDEIFDNIARTLASPMPRRQVLKMAITGIIGAALAGLGIETAWAAQTCLCQGQTYDPATACCTPTGVQQKHPIASLDACINKVAHPGYTCVANGCGGNGGSHYPSGFGAADFLPCCNTHDCCWGTCNNSRATCDTSFGNCLAQACQTAYGGGGVVNTIKLQSCRATANAYESAVSSRFGTTFYVAGQSAACDCCGNEPCFSCAGSSCGSLPSCAGGGDCLCFTSVEGNGACVHGNTPCAGAQPCSSTAGCPQGYACLNTTCCGSFAVCGPLCNPIVGPASSQTLSPLREAKRKGSTMGSR